MTRQKDLKRVVRTRMEKTGESYTAARVHVVGKQRAAASRPAAAATAPPDYAALSAMSDVTVAAKTGASWETWVRRLDDFGAVDKPHGEIAAHVHEAYGVPGWWAQAVTVGYERIRGLRAIGQRRGGAFETSKSRTFAVPVARLFAAWADPKERRRWLPGVALVVRKATPEKSMRITWDDGTLVVVGFLAKGAEKSNVAVQHSKLPDRARGEELKRFWGERLEALGKHLAAGAR
jgi:hypothetical protein